MKRLTAPEYPGKQLKNLMVIFALAFIVFSVGILFIKPSITGLYIYESSIDENPVNGSPYNPSQIYQFNITLTSNETIDSVWIGHNFTGVFNNYTNITNLSNVYTHEYTGLAAGDYAYQWHFNNTIGETNSSLIYNYTVVRADPGLLLSVSPGPLVNYGTTTNVSCTAAGSVNHTLYQNNALVSNPHIAVLNVLAGGYNYTCNNTASQNYTNSSTAVAVTVNPVNPTLTLTFNGTNATNTTNYIVYVPGTVEICLNVTPYSLLANLTIEENKNGTWVVLVNTTGSSGFICYNRTFQNTTDPQYGGTAALALGFSDWILPSYEIPESGSINIIPTNPPLPPGGGGGGGGCNHKCSPLGARQDLTPEIYQICEKVNRCRDWVLYEEIPPVEEPKGILEIVEPLPYKIGPCVQDKLIPAEQGCRYECLSVDRIEELSKNLIENNDLTGAFVFEDNYEILYGFPKGKVEPPPYKYDVEIELIKDGAYQGNSPFLSMFYSDKALWAQVLNFDVDYQILTGMKIICDEEIDPDRIRISLVNDDRLVTFIEKEIPQQHIEAVVRYSNNQFNVLSYSVKPGPVPENQIGPYVGTVYDTNGEVLDMVLFGTDDAVYKSDGTLERKPVEGSVTTVNLPRFDNAMTLSIKNPLDLEEAIGFNIRDILLAKTEDFIIKGEFVSGNCGYGDEGDWCVVNYNVGEISEDILELEFPFEESWPFNKPPMSLPEERPRAEIGNFLEGKCDFNKIVPHKKLEPEEETAPEDGIEPGWGFLLEDLEKFLPQGFDFENLFPKSPDAPEGVIFPCGRLIFVLTLNQESFDEGVDKLSKNDPEGLKFIPELQVIFKL